MTKRNDGATIPENWYLHLHEFLYTKGEQEAEQEAWLIREALGLRPGHRVLDAPCAAGRMAVYLARAGIQVTGVDINLSFLRRARERLQKENLPGSFCCTDIRRLGFRPAFDAAYNWWTSFGYFSDAGNLQALRSLAAAVRPGGRVLIEQPNRLLMRRLLVPVVSYGPWTLRNWWNASRQRIECIWTRTVEEREEAYPMSIRLYTLSQFRELFRRAGLPLEAAYGDYEGRTYHATSPHLVVVGVKPATVSS
ncbi:MAG: class I SAM-dependent methyltransferase [Armatimonadetes bacterium]|nr:class I SAM-dependent methyltransferase [Armatimonadota bacterium]